MNRAEVVQELVFKAVRSGGAGGQHVNKVATKVMLSWDLSSSKGVTEEEKLMLSTRLRTKLTKDNTIILTCDSTRSQLKNKEIVIDRFFEMLAEALKVNKVRKATKISKNALQRRKESNKKSALKKVLRRKIDF